MNLKTLKKTDLRSFMDAIVAGFEVFGPVPKDSSYTFGPVVSFGDITLDFGNTILPPKKFLLPQREELIRYTLDGRQEGTPILEEPKRVIFGARSCDLHGVWLLDDIFADGVQDTHYISRRKGTYFIGLDCKEPCFQNSFCRDMGTLEPAGGFDIFLTDIGDSYIAQVSTEKGVELAAFGAFRQASYEQKEAFYKLWRDRLERFPSKVGYDTERLPLVLADAYDDFIWGALEERCFDCGACTVVCPTCYCFDVLDEAELSMAGGVRYRKWDSCQLRAFAALAGGENMRGKRSDRLRHRIFRKGKYIKERYGRFACVGCGRCGRACLVNIDILNIFNQIKE